MPKSWPPFWRSAAVEYIFGLPGGRSSRSSTLAGARDCAFFSRATKRARRGWRKWSDRSPEFPEFAPRRSTGRHEPCHRIANAWLDRAPMLAVTAEIPEASYATLTHQRVPLRAPVRADYEAHGDNRLPRYRGPGERVADLAARPRTRPLHLALPSDLASSSALAAGPYVRRRSDCARGSRRLTGSSRASKCGAAIGAHRSRRDTGGGARDSRSARQTSSSVPCFTEGERHRPGG